ncbi:hypothetical protein FGSG_13062 [Fusarium graminearum PH-1]|uniref:Chromosome 4, complete genome n=1 Tax=Gibberella zeae (strain ATCC MYA-4620 / CBS 123657 / FGSC 9075 / NRRL 31084 / PH-1) TaxID=229533 RepID=I1S884_GIBZE|nr:hypothetical protein FGSG_13062 [Fusarium graminearum PH-1]ESU13316.1 hypothetical protein FGSG_13062 [Fusarium graminearum PH-1]CEF82778.1 unnamed protein product [Fusarium graminearum]|eukprot:XP_011326823.1 hypothetical protein FGSG_13062 [Fusarium graminearum PH-1]
MFNSTEFILHQSAVAAPCGPQRALTVAVVVVVGVVVGGGGVLLSPYQASNKLPSPSPYCMHNDGFCAMPRTVSNRDGGKRH